MRLLYMDEAGIGNPSQEPWLVVAGVMVDGDGQLSGVTNALESLIVRSIPRLHQANFVFHATELFNGGGRVFKRIPPNEYGPQEWPLDRRLGLALELARIFKKFRLPVSLSFMERAKLSANLILDGDKEKKHATLSAHVATHVACACRAEAFMRKQAPGENCLAIVEDNDAARKSIRDLQNYYQNKELVSSLSLKEDAKRYFPWRRIREDPLFQPKRASSPLVLADFAAYVFKKVLMKDDRYERFFDHFRQDIIVI